MSDCSLLAKLSLMPGCRPWDTPYPEGVASNPQFYENANMVGPFQPSSANWTEFAPVKFVTTSVKKVQADLSRLVSNQDQRPQQQEIPWWNVTARFSAGASAANEAIQSTLMKVLVLVVVVSMIALFGMAFVQAKGAQLAK